MFFLGGETSFLPDGKTVRVQNTTRKFQVTLPYASRDLISKTISLYHQANSWLPFLDVSVYKEASCSLRSIYRKPTFTGLYIRLDSFCPKKRKFNLIKTLIHRALMICSESKLDSEVSFITEALWNIGFPEDIDRAINRDKISHFHKKTCCFCPEMSCLSQATLA